MQRDDVRRRRSGALVLGALGLLLGGAIAPPLAFGGSQADATPVRLIVRSRVGLPAATGLRSLTQGWGRVRDRIDALDSAVVEVPSSQLSSVVAWLRRDRRVAGVEVDAAAHATDLPNDPLFSSQWGVVQINGVESWQLTRGSADVVVAVLDTGVDASHPDLQGQVLPGYDFVNDDGDPSDDNGHGTAMAGIIGAGSNNGVGIAGIAPASPILPVKVLDANGLGFYSTIAKGILYAADHGAHVINLSLAGSVVSTTLQAAIDYARARDVIVVAAAGNSGTNAPLYPAAASGVVAVSATDSNDHRARFSNYGAWIALAAPGVGVTTTVPGGGYAGVTGTSPATAVASGAFALLLAGNPGLSAADAIAVMTQNALDLGTAGWDPYYGFGRVDAFAALVPGQVVRHIVDVAPPVASVLTPSRDSLVYGVVPVDVVANDNVAVARVDLEVDHRLYASTAVAPFAFVWDTTGVAAGSHKLRATAYDAAGNHATTLDTRVVVTPGVGLLVNRTSLIFGRTPGSDFLYASGLFSLPDGSVLDPTTDTVTIELTSQLGTVFALTIPAGSMTADRIGALHSPVLPANAASGIASVRIGKSRTGNSYSIWLLSRRLTVGNIDPTMSLRITVGADVLSQSVAFRHVFNRLVMP